MDEQLILLIRLQELDTTIRGLVDQGKSRTAVLAGLEVRRAASKSDLERAKESLLAAQKTKRDRDQDLEVGAQKVEKLKAHSAGIKNNKEYQALLKETETAEQENKAIEDSILALMERIDAAAGQITAAEQRAQEEARAIQEEQQRYESVFAKVEVELKAVELLRKEMLGRIKPVVLTQYQKLLITKAGVAIAEARGESCSGCYMRIPPQVFVNVKKNESIITCPHCGRILYFKDVIAPPGT